MVETEEKHLKNSSPGAEGAAEAALSPGRTKSPRVTVVARGVHPPWNEGTRVIARNIASALEQAHHPTRTISLTEAQFAKYEPHSGNKIRHVSSSLSYGIAPDYLYLSQIAGRVNLLNRGSEACAIHLVGAPLALSPFISGSGRKIISHVTLSNQVYLSFGERMRAHLGWRLFDRWVDVYACTSEQIRRDLLRRGHSPHKLCVIPPPVDTDCFKPTPREEARAALHLDPDAFLVAYVGTISPRRFPAEEMVRALNSVVMGERKLQMEIYAPVATHRRNKKWANDNVLEQAKQANFLINMHLKDLTETEKALLYSAVDVVLLPFTAAVAVEPPLTLLEAMSCGALVLAAPFANRSQVVRQGINGFTFGNVEEMAAEMRQLLDLGVEGRRCIGAAARQTVVRDYSFETAADSIQRLWTSIGL